ncbi:MAG: FkbM family methyltransferase [Vicinamibacterales bacterium]
MKGKDLIHLLGIRPAEKRYGYRIEQFEVTPYGSIEYAQWLHPAETEKSIRGADVAALRAFLTEGDFCIDVGAHTGDTALPMALAVGPSGCVLALEPNPFVFPVLNKNATLNARHTTIVPYMLAALPEDGDARFDYSDAGFCNGGLHGASRGRWRRGHLFTLNVAGVNLSRFVRRHFADRLPRFRFVKVDAEGQDLQVLRSIADLIDEHRPHVKAEVFKHSNRDDRERLHAFLASRGYAVHRVRGEDDYVGERLDSADMHRWAHFDIFAVPTAR